MGVSLLVIVRDEERMLPGLLESLKDNVDESIIIDDHSTDDTARIARSYGAKVYTVPGNTPGGYPEQYREYALSLCNCEWVLLLDADERPSVYLAHNLKNLCNGFFSGYQVPRRTYYDNKYRLFTRYFLREEKTRLFNKNRVVEYGGIHKDLKVCGDVPRLDGAYYICHLRPGKYDLRKKHDAWIEEEAKLSGYNGFWYHLVMAPLAAFRVFVWEYFAGRSWLDGLPGLVGCYLLARYKFKVHTHLIWRRITC